MYDKDIVYDVSLDYTGELKVRFLSSDIEETVSQNVVDFFIVNEGNGGFHTIFFITEDGKVGSCNAEVAAMNHEKIVVKNDLGYHGIVNVVGIFENNAFVPKFIDINGNIEE